MVPGTNEPPEPPKKGNWFEKPGNGAPAPRGNVGNDVPPGNEGNGVPRGNEGNGFPAGNEGNGLPSGKLGKGVPAGKEGNGVPGNGTPSGRDGMVEPGEVEAARVPTRDDAATRTADPSSSDVIPVCVECEAELPGVSAGKAVYAPTPTAASVAAEKITRPWIPILTVSPPSSGGRRGEPEAPERCSA
jgi:hypothetical protein